MLMAPEPRVTGKRRKAPDHFRSKLGLVYFDSTINRVVTGEGNEDTRYTRTDVTLYLPQMKYAQRPGTKTQRKVVWVTSQGNRHLKSLSQ